MKKNNKVSVMIIGLGESGLSSALWSLRSGFNLIIVDSSLNPKGIESLKNKSTNIKYYLGCNDQFNRDWLSDDISYVVITPGISPVSFFAKSIFEASKEKDIEIIGEVDLFVRALSNLKIKSNYSPKIVAITGTNGKTTVTSLTCKILQSCGISTCKAGNISPSLLGALIDKLDNDNLPDVWVIEISSFQLHGVFSLNPDVSVILNLDYDHIDWHGSIDLYWEAKIKLLKLSKISIINRNDSILVKMSKDLEFSPYTFGYDEPLELDCFGMSEKDGIDWMVARVLDDEPYNCDVYNGNIPDYKDNNLRYILRADLLKVRGLHNYTNVLASLQLVSFLMPLNERMLEVICNYSGEPHRIEFVKEINQISYFDDSKGTNISATVAALKSFNKKVVLIMGGVGKGQDFSFIRDSIEKHVKVLVLIGVSGLDIFKAIKDTNVFIVFASSMEEAVHKSSKFAKSGDIVLLSPACASFDMFDNYEHRSKSFVEAVNSLDKKILVG